MGDGTARDAPSPGGSQAANPQVNTHGQTHLACRETRISLVTGRGGTRGAGATVKTIWKGGGASRAGREHCVPRAPGGRVVTQLAHAQPGATQAGFGLEGRNSSPGLTIPLRQRETSGAYELREDYICIFTNLWDNQTRERGTALASAEGISRRPSGSAPAQRS